MFYYKLKKTITIDNTNYSNNLKTMEQEDDIIAILKCI